MRVSQQHIFPALASMPILRPGPGPLTQRLEGQPGSLRDLNTHSRWRTPGLEKEGGGDDRRLSFD